ncbi:MAG: hypothetical protein ACYDAY_09775 [Candidatus Dormibacteria bacterium]
MGAWLGPGILVAILAVTSTLSLRLGLDSLLGDEGIYPLYGQLTASGRVPYRDFDIPYGPLTAWLNAGLWWLGSGLGNGLVAFRVWLVLLSAAMVMLVFAVSRRVSGSGWWATVAAAYWLAAQVVPKAWVDYPQLHATAMVLLGLLLVPAGRAVGGAARRDRWRWVAAGAAVGVAAGFKHTFGAMVFAGLLVAMLALAGGTVARILRWVAVLCASALLLALTHSILLSAGTVALWALWVAATARSWRPALALSSAALVSGGFGGACLLWAAVAAVEAGPGPLVRNLLAGGPIVDALYVPVTGWAGLVLLLPLAWSLLAARGPVLDGAREPVLARLLLGAAAGGAFAWFPIFDGPHLSELLPLLLPALALLAAAGWARWVEPRPERWLRGVVLAAAVVLIVLPNFPALRYKSTTWFRIRGGALELQPAVEAGSSGFLGDPDTAAEVTGTLAAMRDAAPVGGSAFVFPQAGSLYLLSGLAMATHQPYLYLWITEPARRRETLAELAAAPPQVVVVDRLLAVSPAGDPSFLSGFLAGRYRLAREGTRYLVYARLAPR